MKLCDINAHFRDEIQCNTFKFIYNLTKNIAYKDHGLMLFMGTMVARFDVLISLLMKILMSRFVDWRIVTDVSNERSSCIFRVRQFRNSAHSSWVEDVYFLMCFEVLTYPENSTGRSYLVIGNVRRTSDNYVGIPTGDLAAYMFHG
jgi:hypothetical protein